jgi:hypothetical protein
MARFKIVALVLVLVNCHLSTTVVTLRGPCTSNSHNNRTKKGGFMCRPCSEGAHRMCEQGDCDCKLRKDEEAVERSLAATRQGDGALADVVFTNLMASGSPITKMFLENAGREQTRAFVGEIIRTAAALRC